MQGPAILLIGLEAEALAARLEASGYRSLGASKTEATAPIQPDAAVLAASEAPRIGDLRRRHGGIPILLDLGTDSLEARARCLSSGADDFWLSSLAPSDLLMRLRLHLGLSQQPGQVPPLMQVADLMVNTSGQQVKRGSRQLQLTAREYELLLYLLERQGTVVSRDDLLATIWSDQAGAASKVAASNVIEVYVRYLRQKLEADGERRLIHTVRGRGYCLAAKPPQLKD